MWRNVKPFEWIWRFSTWHLPTTSAFLKNIFDSVLKSYAETVVWEYSFFCKGRVSCFYSFPAEKVETFSILTCPRCEGASHITHILEYSFNHTSLFYILLALSSEPLLWLKCWPASWKICACFLLLSKIFVWSFISCAASLGLSSSSVKWKSWEFLKTILF